MSQPEREREREREEETVDVTEALTGLDPLHSTMDLQNL